MLPVSVKRLSPGPSWSRRPCTVGTIQLFWGADQGYICFLSSCLLSLVFSACVLPVSVYAYLEFLKYEIMNELEIHSSLGCIFL